jgi:O-antigen/teichoic acid export membrane protein
MKIYKKFVTDVLLSGWIDILNNVKNFALIPILTKSLGLTEYGIWVQMKIFLTFIVPVAMLGMSNAIVRYLSGDTDRARVGRDFSSISIFTLANGFLLCALICLFSRPIAAGILHDGNLYYLIRVFGVMLVFESLSVLALSYFRSFRIMKLFSIVSFFEICIEFSSIVLAIRAGYGFLGAVTVMVMVRSLFVYIKYSRIYRRIDFSVPSMTSLKKFALFSLPLLVSANMFYIVDSGDKYVVNFFLGLEQSAVYSLAYSLAYTVVLITAPVIYILHPAIAACCNTNKLDEARVYITYSYKFFIALGIPFCFLAGAFARDLIYFISTKDFSGAAQYLPFLLFSLLIFQIGVISEYINIVFNRTMFVLYLHTGLAAFNIVMNIILVPRYHIMAAVMVNAATYLAFFTVNFLYSRRFIRFGLEPWNVARIAVVACILTLGIKSLQIPVGVKVFCVIPCAVVVYLFLLRILGIVTGKEVDFIKSLFIKRGPAA